MKKISVWAKHHNRLARIIIIISFVLLTATGIAIGMLLDNLTITISSFALPLCILIYFLGILFYPHQSVRRKATAALFYKKQKANDLILAASTFLMIVCISNHGFRDIQYFPSTQAATSGKTNHPIDSTVKNYKSIASFSASLKNENGKSLKWKEKKKLLKEQVRAIKKSKDTSNGVKAGLIILSVLAALGLIYLVAALACSVSCNGSEAAAVIIGVGGTALVIFLLVVVIRAITGKKKKKAIIQEEPVQTE